MRPPAKGRTTRAAATGWAAAAVAIVGRRPLAIQEDHLRYKRTKPLRPYHDKTGREIVMVYSKPPSSGMVAFAGNWAGLRVVGWLGLFAVAGGPVRVRAGAGGAIVGAGCS